MFGVIGLPQQEATEGDRVTDSAGIEPGLPADTSGLANPDFGIVVNDPFGIKQEAPFRLLHPDNSS